MAQPPSQRDLSSELEKIRVASLLSASSVADRLRLASAAAPRSAAWLMAMPCRGPLDLTLTADQVQIALQHRLGLPLAEAGDHCTQCGGLLDLLGHHHLTCKYGGHPGQRHNRLRDSLFRLLTVAGMSPRLEQGAFDRDL